jgi:hypothetical protein
VENPRRLVRIYTDTNVLRYFGSAFAARTLAEDLPVQLLVSPLALMEPLSQLGNDQAQEAFNAVQALPRVHNQGPTGVLPWSDNFFRMALFSQSPREDATLPRFSTARLTGSRTLPGRRISGLRERRCGPSSTEKKSLDVTGEAHLLAHRLSQLAMLLRREPEVHSCTGTIPKSHIVLLCPTQVYAFT